MSKHKVIFPQNLIIEAETGATLKELMNRKGLNLTSPAAAGANAANARYGFPQVRANRWTKRKES